MRIRFAIALFVLLGLCSVASMKPVPANDSMFEGGGGGPTPCFPPGGVCPVHK